MAKIGRPRLWPTIEEFTRKANKYFKEMETSKDPLTITGFCVFLGTYRDELALYERGTYDDAKNMFSSAIKQYKEKIACFVEKGTTNSKINASAGIFLLKNHGFTDKSEVDLKVSGLDLGKLAKGAEDEDRE